MRGILACCFAATCLTATAASAADHDLMSGYAIRAFCEPMEHPSDLLACAALIGTAADAANSSTGVMGYKSCLPRSVTVEQIRLLTLDMLKQRPDWLSEAAFEIVGAVTSAAFPCK